jgi:small-conductance mechanosensitive channel
LELPEHLFEERIVQKAIATIAWVALVLALRALAMRAVRAAEYSSDQQRLRWHVRVAQATILLVALGLLVIWISELKTLALSAVALAAAIALSGKELIMCLSGATLRTMSGSYSVGDRIEVGGLRGDVVAYGMLSTTIMEIGPAHQATGRAVTFPNSTLLSAPVINETSTGEFVLHSFQVHLSEGDDWKLCERTLHAVADEASQPHREAARRHFEELQEEHGISAPNVEAKVAVRILDDGRVALLVRVPTPARMKGRIEQEIIRGYLDRLAQRRGPRPA